MRAGDCFKKCLATKADRAANKLRSASASYLEHQAGRRVESTVQQRTSSRLAGLCYPAGISLHLLSVIL